MKLWPRGLQALDSLAHFLYCPGMAGKRIAVARWYHRIHLIPGWLLRLVCDLHERSIWAEFDTPESEIDAMMAKDELVALESGRICGWKCPHLTMTAILPGILTGPPTTSWCDCEMEPIYATPATS